MSLPKTTAIAWDAELTAYVEGIRARQNTDCLKTKYRTFGIWDCDGKPRHRVLREVPAQVEDPKTHELETVLVKVDATPADLVATAPKTIAIQHVGCYSATRRSEVREGWYVEATGVYLGVTYRRTVAIGWNAKGESSAWTEEAKDETGGSP